MLTYILRRLMQMAVTLVIISIVSFLVVYTAPGNPFTSGLDPNSDPTTTEIQIEQYNLDEPLYYQYVSFFGDFFSDCWIFVSEGVDSPNYALQSFKSSEAVIPTMMRKMLVTLPLVIISTLLTWTLAFPLGIYSALNRGTWKETLITTLAYASIALPSFWLALLVLNFFTSTLGIPLASPSTLGAELTGLQGAMDKIWHWSVPSAIAALGGIGLLSRYVKGQMLEVLDADFVRTARAKGLDRDTVNYKHALRNAALPFVTMIASILPALFSGSLIFEAIYAWPGIGRWAYNAAMQRDYSIVITTLFVSSSLTLVGLLISDLLYGVVDPRIKLS